MAIAGPRRVCLVFFALAWLNLSLSAQSTAAGESLPDAPSAESSSQHHIPPPPPSAVTPRPATPQKWDWKASTLQSFEFTMFNHVWTALVDEPMYQLHGCATRSLNWLGPD